MNMTPEEHDINLLKSVLFDINKLATESYNLKITDHDDSYAQMYGASMGYSSMIISKIESVLRCIQVKP